MTCTRPKCGGTMEIKDFSGIKLSICSLCNTGAAVPKGVTTSKPTNSGWSAAKSGSCSRGHHHASKLEIRTCEGLFAEYEASTARIYVGARFPLLNLAAGKGDKPLFFTPDFVVVIVGTIVRAVESKGRISRDFEVRRRAFEAQYGVTVEIVTA